MKPQTYYLTWADRVITLIVVAPGKDGLLEATKVGRRDRFKEVLGERPFPTSEKSIRLLAMKVGATVKTSP